MRTRGVWIVLMAGIALAGCNNPDKRPLFGKKPEKDAKAGTPTPAFNPRPLTPPTTGKGLLAGYILDGLDRRVPKAAIQVVELRDTGPAGAPFEIEANEQGIFTIPGLDAGRSYQLTARVAEGGKVTMAGMTTCQPPNPKVLIQMSEGFVTASTPLPPGPGVLPGIGAPKKDEPKAEEKPPATLGMPPPMKPEEPPAKPEKSEPPDNKTVVDPPTGENPEVKTPRPDLRIKIPPLSIPGPRDYETRPVLSGQHEEKTTPVGREATAPYASQPLPVPSCIMLTPRQIDNFALQDAQSGQGWELNRDRKGRLVLLDFWHTRCGPCLRAIQHLNELHDAYGARGLEVVGVAYEQRAGGPQPDADQATRQVLAAKSRFNMRYRLLMGGDQGPLRPCPLFTQLGIAVFPTLKLLDERGNIVWQCQGLGEREMYELRTEIERRLMIR